MISVNYSSIIIKIAAVSRCKYTFIGYVNLQAPECAVYLWVCVCVCVYVCVVGVCVCDIKSEYQQKKQIMCQTSLNCAITHSAKETRQQKEQWKGDWRRQRRGGKYDLSEILAITNFWYVARRVWTSANLSSGLVEWSCVVVITTTSRRH